MLIYLTVLETEGEKRRFAEIYEENYLKMYHVALRMLKRQPESENAVHEAFLSIAENFKKYSELSGREMTGLCVTIVKNKAIDVMRKERHLTESDIEELVIADESAEASPEKMYERSEETEQLQRVLEKLPEILKETLVLKYYYGYGNREIAKLMGVTVKTVEMRLYRGKAKLREILNEKD